MPPKLRVSPSTANAGVVPFVRNCDRTGLFWACSVANSSGRDGDTEAAPSRNTERRTSGRASSSSVGPWKRISPFSMK